RQAETPGLLAPGRDAWPTRARQRRLAYWRQAETPGLLAPGRNAWPTGARQRRLAYSRQAETPGLLVGQASVPVDGRAF
ncbi:MAG TPA: hypothetical protein PLQ35_14325, partial [bacterium]|nr:hypothetical protein [bacterium]